MNSSQQQSSLPNFYQTVLVFMGFRSEADLRFTKIDEEFYEDFESAAERILKLNNELGTRFRLELMQAGQDVSTFKLMRGHKQILEQLGPREMDDDGLDE